MKRHPRACKMLKLNNLCQFGHECAYNHASDIKVIDPHGNNSELNQKVAILEKTIQDQAERIKNLEADMKLLEFVVHEQGKINETPINSELEKYRNHEGNRVKKQSKICEKEEEIDEETFSEAKDNLFKYNDCSYKCKKKGTLKKHIKSNHEKRESCNVSRKLVKEKDYLQKHSKKDHNEKEGNKKIYSSFKFSESMLDKWDK